MLGVILPSSFGGILTGTVLAVARAAGETAPLLFTSSIFTNSVQTDVTKPLPNIPVLIFTYSEQPDPALHEQAWAAALVLMAFVLVASLARRRCSRAVVESWSMMNESITMPVIVAPSQVARKDAEPDREQRGRLRHPEPDRQLRQATAISGVDLEIYRNLITAMIGPSGCGKSTFIRCLNRMNDLVPGAKIDGKILYHGPGHLRRRRRPGRGAPAHRHGLPEAESVPEVDLRQRRLGPARARDEEGPRRARREGAYAARRSGTRSRTGLKKSALSLSGGQQQRLCIARAIAVEPDVLLLDEPASALDPIATSAIEELMHELKHDYTLVIVTHNMQQAARVADLTAFFSLEVDEGRRTGVLVEYDSTDKIFTNPADKRTEDYVTGRFG